MQGVEDLGVAKNMPALCLDHQDAQLVVAGLLKNVCLSLLDRIEGFLAIIDPTALAGIV